MAYVIVPTCINCGACVSVCPTNSIEAGGSQHYINPQTCIDCGACASVCPTASIFPQTEVPAEYQSSIQENANYFANK